MEQGLFIFLFIISFIFLLLAIFKDDDWQMQGLFSLFSGIFFLALAILSFNIENLVYDSSLGTFVQYNMASNSLQAFLPFGLCLILSIFSFLNTFQIFTYKAMSKTSQGLQIPKGFQPFNGIGKIR